MVWLLMNNLDYETARRNSLSARSPFLEFGTFLNQEDKTIFDIGDTVERVELLKSPRLIKSHLPLQLLPLQLWTVKPKIIYVARDPKDVVASYYHHHRLWFGYTGTCEDFIEDFIAGHILYGSLWDHILAFWEIRNESNVLFNTFEEMKRDLPSVIRRTAKFINCNLQPDQMEQLCKHLSFESMKNNPSVSHEDELSKIKLAEMEGKVERFMRKGQVGGWKSDFTPELSVKINKWSLEKIKGTGYDKIDL